VDRNKNCISISNESVMHMDVQTFIAKRYKREKKTTDRSKEANMIANTWLLDDNVGSWRHKRMIQCVDPLIESYPKANWLTVGDSRFGNEAHYIWKKGRNVVASNISDQLLKKAKKINFIPDYIVENAEQLTLNDRSFDFILCKESLHHFPRPFIGLYEMIRVAKKAVILMEPNDIFHDHTLFQELFWNAKMFIKRMLHIAEYLPFERAGNYIYRVSVSEVEKLSSTLNLSLIAYRGINDIYYKGVEFAAVPYSVLYIKVQLWIWLLDALSNLGFLKHNDICIIIWKTMPTKQCIVRMKSLGFHIVNLQKNPYV